ncbi:IclR family transcriptional regulator C-terminal domain-containing protein [Nocardioides sp. YIM 152315]|uniref:IclR family transcriptional regulator domain-containing protein n=1 Tax=Nocardioides sp. YIM 152315 TaxID=3031760 RepID=UPI0023DAF14F|nr:IclR family transcriptional regulator C-terminal domain-containing protein [Nocardioides sp. YIM 152315]MDF1602122.1 IclR family transcriptional regulator C-terminal domain-containing protein [Nocardioides sp. YIM 152315]
MHPYLERLSSGLGETVHLGRLDGDTVSFVDAVESPRAVRVGSRLGKTMPAHCTSSGKALLTMLDEPAIRTLYPDEKLPRLTPQSVTKHSVLLKAGRRGPRPRLRSGPGSCCWPRRVRRTRGSRN